MFIHEIHEGKHEKTEEGYKDIKPASDLSLADASSFWADQFKSQTETNEYPDELLIKEVYGRTENEINIRFEFNQKIIDTLSSFTADNWDIISDEEKLGLIMDLIDEVSDVLGIQIPPDFDFYLGEKEECGQYSYETNKILINDLYFTDSRVLLDTIMHELRHAYQHQRAELNETFEDAIFKFNFEHYISPIFMDDGSIAFYMDYVGQYVEVDARVFARKFEEAVDSL